MKDYYFNKSFKLIQKQKDFHLKNHDRIKNYKNEHREKINEYNKKIYKTKETNRYYLSFKSYHKK